MQILPTCLSSQEHNLPDKATKRMRVLQSDSVKSAMKAKDKLQKASKRASEQTVHRREKDRSNKASTRASETSEQTVHRPHLHGEKNTSPFLQQPLLTK